MENTDSLFSLLRFVALAVPAVAILMQVIQQNDETSSAPLRFLEISFLFMVFGGIVIMTQLLDSIGDNVVYLGTLLIFGSLIFLGSAIAWHAIPATRDLELSISSMKSFKNFSTIVVGRLIAFSIPFMFMAIIYYLIADFVNRNLSIGLISEIDQLDPSIFYGIILLLIAIRTVLYLLNVGYLEKYSTSDVAKESFQASLLMNIVIPVFIIPVVVVLYVIVNLPSFGLGLNVPDSIFVSSYIWTMFVVLSIYATEFWAEKEDEERLVE